MKLKLLPVCLLLAGALAVGVWSLGRQKAPPGPSATESPDSGRKTKRLPTPHSGHPDHQARVLAAKVDALAGAGTTDDAKRRLEELRAWLGALPPGQAAALISGFIASGRDAELPLEFRIGEGGFLETPPTIRVALLDMLGRLDPEAAHALGREILATPTSADEWAVALRNVAKLDSDTDQTAFLRHKTEELIRHPRWQKNPTVGYLNAFDVLVHTRATESTPLLSGLIRNKERRDLAHASFLTLDRLTQREPVAMLEALQQDEALHRGRPEMVAQQFARADLREPAQREIVRDWLLDSSRTRTELQSFAGVFPNNNQMVSQNLLTRDEPLQGADLRAHDEAVLAIVRQWAADPAFQTILPHLNLMHRRLQQFSTSGLGDAPPVPPR